MAFGPRAPVPQVSFGENMLHTIGFIYTNVADQALGNYFGCGRGVTNENLPLPFFFSQTFIALRKSGDEQNTESPLGGGDGQEWWEAVRHGAASDPRSGFRCCRLPHVLRS